MTHGAFHALVTSLNVQHSTLTYSYNHVTITWLSGHDCCSLLIPLQWTGILLADRNYLSSCYQSPSFS